MFFLYRPEGLGILTFTPVIATLPPEKFSFVRDICQNFFRGYDATNLLSVGVVFGWRSLDTFGNFRRGWYLCFDVRAWLFSNARKLTRRKFPITIAANNIAIFEFEDVLSSCEISGSEGMKRQNFVQPIRANVPQSQNLAQPHRAFQDSTVLWSV